MSRPNHSGINWSNAAEKNAYQRGYHVGSKGAWPDHRPPEPPSAVMGTIITTATAMRDALDSELALMIRGDPMWGHLNTSIDDFDAAMEGLSEWLRDPTPTEPTP